MSKRYPFKFLNAYDRADIDIFFGRDEEIDQLYQMVFQSNLLLVYGPSGAGKTSLINCGLASRFQTHDWLAIHVRRGANLNVSLREKLEAAAGEPVAAGLDVDWLEDDEEETAGPAPAPLSPLARQFKNIYLRHFRPIYLIFDQFEELFVLGDAEEQKTFIQTVQEILKVDDPVKMIFSMREEYLGHLFEFERAVPQLLRKKLRIEPMHLDKVRQVMLGAAGLQDKGPRTNIQLQPGEEEAIVREVFDKIKGGEKTLTIKLPYLQVFLDKLYLRLTGDQDRQAEAAITLAALAETGDIGDVLREFLEDEAQRIERELAKKYPGLPEDAVWRILSPFATLEGTKEPLSRAELQERLGSDFPEPVVRTALQELENHRILRHEEGGDLYEVAHDSLARRIADHRSDEEIALLEIRRLINSQASLEEDARQLFSEKQLNLIDPFLDKLALDAEEKALIEASRQAVIEQRAAEQRRAEAEKERLLERQRLLERTQRTQRWFLGGMGVALAAMVLLAVWAFGQEQRKAKALTEAYALNQKNERLIDALYFYDDQYALAVKQTAWGRAEYGYIDKEGNTRIKFEYTEAQPFEDNGFARVKIKNQLYLIDTTGRKYALAESLEQLNSKTEALDLRYKELTILPDSISLFPQLKILLLSGTGLTALPENIGALGQLQVLDLGYNLFSKLPRSLGQLTQLQDLYLNNCDEMTQAPGFLPQLKHLRRLDLSFNQLQKLPESFGQLQQLRSLALGGNLSLELPESLGQLKELEDMYLQGIKLSQLPSFVGELQKLRRLNLSGNELDSLPDFVSHLEKLQGLYLYGNKLDELPESFGQLQQLRNLDLSGNQLKELPTSFKQLQQLRDLDLSDNQLKKLPESFEQLEQLRRLMLGGNQLTQIPEFLSQLRRIEVIDFSNNKLTQIPAFLNQFQDLRILVLSNNQLTQVPEVLNQLREIETIIVSGNPITQVPPDFQSWKKTALITALIDAWEDKLADSLSIYRRRQYHLDLTKLLSHLRDVDEKNDIFTPNHLYHLARHRLFSGQFAEAEIAVRHGLKDEPNSYKFNRLLPPVQLLRGQYKTAKADYLRLKEVVIFDPAPGQLPYQDAFLEDLAELERLALIPKAYEKQAAEIRALLRGETR